MYSYLINCWKTFQIISEGKSDISVTDYVLCQQLRLSWPVTKFVGKDLVQSTCNYKLSQNIQPTAFCHWDRPIQTISELCGV